eukprot:5840644-Pyramimonas_sp.AAC.1
MSRAPGPPRPPGGDLIKTPRGPCVDHVFLQRWRPKVATPRRGRRRPPTSDPIEERETAVLLRLEGSPAAIAAEAVVHPVVSAMWS